jgi:hypothetical protein
MTDLALYDVDGAPLAHLHAGGVAFAGRALPATTRPRHCRAAPARAA